MRKRKRRLRPQWTHARGQLADTEQHGRRVHGGLGTAPSLTCPTGCAIDSAAPVKVASEPSGQLLGEGTWTTSGFSTSSLALAVPTTLRALPNEETYRVNVLWTLSTGP